MAVPSVFLSSVVVGFEDVRDAAAAGVRTVGMHALRSEELSANPANSRRTLLDQLERSDYYVLLLGERYGDYRVGESSPTEEEYAEATRLHKPILVVVQEVELELRQQQFLERVRGAWGDGVFYGRFSSAADVGAAVAAALARQQAGLIEDGPAAQERARALAGENDRGGSGSGIAARVAFAPLRRSTLLDALALEEPGLDEDVAAALRSAGAVPHSVGIDVQVSAAGVRLTGNADQNWTTPAASVEVDGAITVLGSVAVEGQLGLSAVDPERLRSVISRAGGAAQLILDRIDTRGEIRRLAVAAAVLGAAYKGYGAPAGNSTHVAMTLPEVVLAPQPPEIVSRAQLADAEVARRLEAAIKRVFVDAGALQQ